MIIDIHTHVFPEKIAESALRSMQGNSHTALYSDGTAGGLRAGMARAGIGLSVVQPVATNPAKLARLNDSVLEINRGTAETGILSFGAMHPACETWEEEMERLARAGVKGIKLHPCYENVGIDDPRTVRILKRCREYGMIVLIHSGWDVGLPGSDAALPAKTRRALDAAGNVTMIAAHMGGWDCWEEAADLLAETGVYIDTAFSLGRIMPAPGDSRWTGDEADMLSAERFCALADRYGTDRVLFGTDSPWTDPEEELAKIRALPLPAEAVEGILGGNAEKLLGRN